MSDESREMMSSHRQAWELIPWVVNGSATDRERSDVEIHLETCEDCRDELLLQRRISDELQRETAEEADPLPALQRLWARIDAPVDGQRRESAMAPQPADRHWNFRRRAGRGLQIAVIVQSMALCILGAGLWLQLRGSGQVSAPARYQTLSASSALPTGATIRLVPSPSLRLDQLQALLQRSQLQIVAGPSEAGVYTLAPRGGLELPTAVALAQLRENPGIRFAEPVANMADRHAVP